ncbi:hypothetical protein PG994_003473 [Apiospora phragmitis]|uniref:SET domain-containing protein n=1 Tax=Apiospora phragmitis TaxID=2905665 RepID=A0ABR1VY76_9PEZI
MASFPLNDYVIVRASSTSTKGAGLFAKRDLEPGRRVVCEDPLLMCDDLPLKGQGRTPVMQRLSKEQKERFARLPTGPGDVFRVLGINSRPLIPGDAESGIHLMNAVKYNDVRLQTAHCEMVGFFTAVVSHSCTPNSYLCYNEATESMDLHLVHKVAKDEEITVSYFQDNYSFPQSVRAERLQKWNFTCTCSSCTTNSAISDTRRARVKWFFSDYDQLTMTRLLNDGNIISRRGRVNLGNQDVWDMMEDLRQILQHMKDEGLYGVAMTSVLMDLACLYEDVGDLQNRRANMREALRIQEMCLGVFHPDTRALARLTS